MRSFVSVHLYTHSINKWPNHIFQGVSFRFIIFDFILSFFLLFYSFISLQANTNTSSHFDGPFRLQHCHEWSEERKNETNK